MPSPVVLFDQTYNGVMRKGLYQAARRLAVLPGPRQWPAADWYRRKGRAAGTTPGNSGDPALPAWRPVRWTLRGANGGLPTGGLHLHPVLGRSVLLQYSAGAGSNWYPTAYSQQTGYVYVMGNGPRPSATSVKQEQYTPANGISRATS